MQVEIIVLMSDFEPAKSYIYIYLLVKNETVSNMKKLNFLSHPLLA